MRHGRAADGYLVLPRSLAVRGIDDELHFPVLDQIEKMRAPLREFVDQLGRDTGLGQHVECSLGRVYGEAKVGEIFGNADNLAFVGVLHADEDVPLGRQCRLGGHLGFRVGDTQILVDAHDLAGRAHLRAERDVDPGEFDEGKHRLFDRVMLRHNFFSKPEVFEFVSGHNLGRQFG